MARTGWEFDPRSEWRVEKGWLMNENVENERSLCGSVILAPEKVMPICMSWRVDEHWFSDAKCLTFWLGLKKLWDEKKLEGMDLVTVLDACRRVAADGGPKKNTRAVDVTAVDMQAVIDITPTAAHAEYYLQLVKNQYVTRLGRKLARELHDALPAGPPVALQKHMNGIVGLMESVSPTGENDLHRSTDKVMAQFQDAHRIRMVEGNLNYTPGIAMPWRKWTFMYNGLTHGLHIVGARPSVGKTALMVNKIRFWCDALKLNVGFNSLDMEPTNLMYRCVSELSRVSLPKAMFGTTNKHDLERLETARQRIDEWGLFLTVKRDLEEFRSWCIMQKAKNNLDVVIVDFLQLLTFDGCYKMGVDDRVAHISGTLKSIANDLKVPVIALSQLNRACEENGGREPNASDLRGSGALEQDAMTVLLLHMDVRVKSNWALSQPHWLTPFGASKEANMYLAKELRPVWAILAKNQNGRTDRMPLVLFPNYFLFMLGDYNAEAQMVKEEGKRIEVKDWSASFGRVHKDWRKDRMEELLAKSGGLVTEYEDGK